MRNWRFGEAKTPQSIVCRDERKYPSGSRGSPAKGVVRVNRSEGSNPSFRAKTGKARKVSCLF